MTRESGGRVVSGARCPDCGTVQESMAAGPGLCPSCLLELALDVTSLETPLLALRHEALMARLSGLTNVRAIEDPAATSGWRLEIGPFAGWQEVPEW